MLTGNPGPATALPLETRSLLIGPLAQETRGSRVRTEAPHPGRAEGGGGDQCPALDTTWAASQPVRGSVTHVPGRHLDPLRYFLSSSGAWLLRCCGWNVAAVTKLPWEAAETPLVV